MKILLLTCHWIGDNFWALQVIPYIRKEYPNAEIWVGIKSHSKDLLYGLIDQNKIIELNNVISDRHREDFKFSEYKNELKETKTHKFDIGVDLTGNRYSALFLFLVGVKKRIGLDLHKLSFLYNIKGGKFDYSKHLINRPFEVTSLLFPIIKPKYLKPTKSNLLRNELQKSIDFSFDDKLALLIPGAGWPEKQWHIDNFAECGKILEKNDYKIIIVGSTKELLLCKKLLSMLNDAVVFVKPLKEFIGMIPYIDIAIANDSGPAHLLAAAKIKTITIFCGNTDPDKCKPIGENVTVIQTANVNTGFEDVTKILTMNCSN